MPNTGCGSHGSHAVLQSTLNPFSLSQPGKWRIQTQHNSPFPMLGLRGRWTGDNREEKWLWRQREKKRRGRRGERPLKRDRRRGMMERAVSDMSKLKPLVLKTPPSMSRVVTSPSVDDSQSAGLCHRRAAPQKWTQFLIISPPFFSSTCLPALCPLIFPKVIMSRVSLPWRVLLLHSENKDDFSSFPANANASHKCLILWI